jgi:predicted enzyme related to lactoylglutathione lyase
MSERDSYPHGVPSWVELLTSDPAAARGFYAQVFGWDFAGPGDMPNQPGGEYFVARLRGRDVAGIGSLPEGVAPSWITQIRAESADETAEAAGEAGGTVVVAPFDVPPVGRMAVLEDPAGARFVAWEAGAREGAQIVNEPSAWSMSMLRTPDPDAAQAFYGALFGWTADSFGPGHWILRLPGYVGGEPTQPVPRDVVAVLAQHDGPASWQPDFWIASADAAAAAASEHGGQVVEPPAELQGAPFRSAVLADGSGAIFSISQLMLVGAENGA